MANNSLLPAIIYKSAVDDFERVIDIIAHSKYFHIQKHEPTSFYDLMKSINEEAINKMLPRLPANDFIVAFHRCLMTKNIINSKNMKEEKLLVSKIYPSHVTEFLQKFMSFSEKQLQEQKKQLNIIRQRRDGVTPSISPCRIYYRDVMGTIKNKIKQMIMEKKFERFTPQNIENLADNEVFVFGSNMAGGGLNMVRVLGCRGVLMVFLL
jgi:hypothetical protein